MADINPSTAVRRNIQARRSNPFALTFRVFDDALQSTDISQAVITFKVIDSSKVPFIRLTTEDSSLQIAAANEFLVQIPGASLNMVGAFTYLLTMNGEDWLTGTFIVGDAVADDLIQDFININLTTGGTVLQVQLYNATTVAGTIETPASILSKYLENSNAVAMTPAERSKLSGLPTAEEISGLLQQQDQTITQLNQQITELIQRIETLEESDTGTGGGDDGGTGDGDDGTGGGTIVVPTTTYPRLAMQDFTPVRSYTVNEMFTDWAPITAPVVLEWEATFTGLSASGVLFEKSGSVDGIAIGPVQDTVNNKLYLVCRAGRSQDVQDSDHACFLRYQVTLNRREKFTLLVRPATASSRMQLRLWVNDMPVLHNESGNWEYNSSNNATGGYGRKGSTTMASGITDASLSGCTLHTDMKMYYNMLPVY